MSTKLKPQHWPMWLMWRLGVNAVARRRVARPGRFALVFHGVARQRYPDVPAGVQPHHTADELRQTLAWLAARFAFLTPDEFLHGSRPGVLLTFDDGLANNFEVALPILETFAAPALFFVATGHIAAAEGGSRWLHFCRAWAAQGWGDAAAVPAAIGHEFYDGMTEAQLAACGRHPLITLGGHTVTHPFLTQCDAVALAGELGECRRYLQAVTGQPVDTFAYPANDYDRRVAEAARQAGYAAAFAVSGRGAGLPAYEIPRIGLYTTHPAYLGSKLNGLHRRPLVGPALPEGA